jgi:hypothetical protein
MELYANSLNKARMHRVHLKITIPSIKVTEVVVSLLQAKMRIRQSKISPLPHFSPQALLHGLLKRVPVLKIQRLLVSQRSWEQFQCSNKMILSNTTLDSSTSINSFLSTMGIVRPARLPTSLHKLQWDGGTSIKNNRGLILMLISNAMKTLYSPYSDMASLILLMI